jgi:magnesium-transporting ATPase (P-type)
MEVHGWESEFAIMKARTMMFGLIVFFELFFALSCRSFKHNIRTLGLLGNRLLIYSLIGESTAMLFIMNHPAMQDIFDLTPLEPMDWAFMLMLATTGFACSEIVKFLTKRKNINKNKH